MPASLAARTRTQGGPDAAGLEMAALAAWCRGRLCRSRGGARLRLGTGAAAARRTWLCGVCGWVRRALEEEWEGGEEEEREGGGGRVERVCSDALEPWVVW